MDADKSRRSSVESVPIIFPGEQEVIAFDEGCTVPRHDGRQSINTEKWILGRYLRALAAAGSLMYPFTVIPAEQSMSPDFILLMPGGRRIGLELTEASTPEAHRLFIESERSEGKAISCDDGVVGDAPAREWAANVCERVRVKAAKLASGHWTPADSHVLVIYENAPTSVPVNLPKTLSYLRLILAPNSGFSNVSIIADSALKLISLMSNTRTLQIPPKGKSRG